MIFYKHFIGDYQRKTAALSMVEHGAYRLMLDEFYSNGEPLPLDRKALYRLVRADGPAERKAVDTILTRFWHESPQGWVNARALEEITFAGTVSTTNRNTALAREAARRAAREAERAEHERDHEPGHAEQHEASTETAPHARDQSHSQSQKKNPRAERGARIPDGWRPSDAALAWAAEDKPDVDTDAATAAFVDYFAAKTGQDATALDWDARWRNWIRREKAAPKGLNGHAFEPRDEWWKSDTGTDRKGRELGVTARSGESYSSFRERIWERVRGVEHAT